MLVETYGHREEMKQEIERVIRESQAKLNQMAVPPIRRSILERQLGRSLDEPILQKAIEECKIYPPMVKMLARQRPDGTWPITREREVQERAGPGPPYGWTYITMLRNLYMLHEYWTPPDSGYIREALERILTWQHPDGYIKGPDPDMIPRVYYIGLALGVFIKLEMDGDKRVDALRNWLIRAQRPDGGWNIPYIQDMRYLPEYAHLKRDEFIALKMDGKTIPYDPDDYRDVPSCIWTTVGAMRGLSMIPTLFSDKRLKKGGDFILDRFFKRNRHPSYYQSGKNWTMLKFPTYFGSGLTALDILVHLGYGPEDSRMEKPIRWILDSRSKDGLWHRSNRPHPIDDQFISDLCLTILSTYHRMF